MGNQPDVVSPEGMRVMCSVQLGGDNESLPESNNRIEVVSSAKKIRKHSCGHRGAKWFTLSVYGEETKKIKHKCAECCIEELKEVVIRCALCGLPIYPGEGVAIYYKDSGAVVLENPVLVGKDGVIGCLRWDCCPSGGFFAGHWSLDGYQPLEKK